MTSDENFTLHCVVIVCMFNTGMMIFGPTLWFHRIFDTIPVE